MFVAADFVLGIVCALLTDFETLCVGFAAPIVSGHQQLISSLWILWLPVKNQVNFPNKTLAKLCSGVRILL